MLYSSFAKPGIFGVFQFKTYNDNERIQIVDLLWENIGRVRFVFSWFFVLKSAFVQRHFLFHCNDPS